MKNSNDNNDNNSGRKGRQVRENKWLYTIQAFYKTLEMLGEPSKKALLYALEVEYNISFSEKRCSSPEQIEAALRNLFGPGAEIIINRWKQNMA